MYVVHRTTTSVNSGRLEDEGGNDVASRNRRDLIPEVREPAGDVDTDEVEYHDRNTDSDQPSEDLHEAARAGGMAERENERRAQGSGVSAVVRRSTSGLALRKRPSVIAPRGSVRTE